MDVGICMDIRIPVDNICSTFKMFSKLSAMNIFFMVKFYQKKDNGRK